MSIGNLNLNADGSIQVALTPEILKAVVPKKIAYNRIFMHDKCPLMYFLSYSTPYGERRRPSVDKVYKGAVWHQVMEDWEKGKEFSEQHLAEVCSRQYRQFDTRGWPAPTAYIKEMLRICKKGFESRQKMGLGERGKAEVTFKADLGDGIIISGRVDRIGEEGGTIIDYKCRSPGADMFQLKCYLVGLKNDSRWPTQSRALFLYAGGSTEEVDASKNPLTMGFIEHEVKTKMQRFLVSVKESCKNGSWPALIGHQCSWCVFKTDCPEQQALNRGRINL